MPLDEATRRLALSLQRDLRRLVDRERARTDRGEEVRYDTVSRMATWETRRGDVIGRWYGEVIASYVLKDRILRWAWAGRASIATTTHSEVISREGQSRNVPQLSMSVVGDLDEEEAATLARLGALVSRGEGLSIRAAVEGEISFVGLFDSPRPRDGEGVDPSRYSVPPPPVAPTMSSSSTPALPPPARTPTMTSHPSSSSRSSSSIPPRRGSTPPAPYRSLPPITEIYGPRSPPKSSPSAAPATNAPTKIREPARGLFVPIATTVLAMLTKVVPGFQQALFVVLVHAEIGKPNAPRRLVVMLAAVDATGILQAIDPTVDLIEAAARMVEADHADGNGPWRKLSTRITPKADGGATLNVDVI